MQQLTTWRVVIGKDMLVGHMRIHSYQLQFIMWQVVTQSCGKIDVPNISPIYFLELFMN